MIERLTHRLLVLLLVITLIVEVKRAEGVNLLVNTSTTIGQLKHFWKSTGFSPPDPHDKAFRFDLGSDMVHNLAHIAAVPQGGIEQVRIHYLLDLVTVESVLTNSSVQSPVYNFTQLDNLMDLLYQLQLKPGFELMGNPSKFFNNFDDTMSVLNWKELVKQTAQRYVDEYGLGYVSDWNFESWNEPEGHHFDEINITVQGFLNYYDACSEGLREVSPLLVFGGPAGDDSRKTVYTDALLNHVDHGLNYFTGGKVRMDFISYHKKGKGSSATILHDEIALMKDISSRFPSLAAKPFYNDEADPLVGWSKPEEWRADATYAAMVAKVIVQHQKAFISNPSPAIQNYTLLSNDNAFLSWFPNQFTERTLLARLQINNTSPPHTQFFQKPVHSVMGMLALLGEVQVQALLTDKAGHLVEDNNLGVLASVHIPEINGTSDSWQMSTIVYLSNDTGKQSGSRDVEVYMDVQPPAWAGKEMVLILWLLDNTVTNPYKVWKDAGKPPYPDIDLMQKMRTREGSTMLYITYVSPGHQYVGSVNLVEPGILLVHVCSQPAYKPDQVNNVQLYNITSGQVLITWSDKCVNSRCIIQYEVVFSKTGADDTYVPITPKDYFKHTTSFTYTPTDQEGQSSDDMVIGYYKVAAIDYFANKGEYSLPTHYP